MRVELDQVLARQAHQGLADRGQPELELALQVGRAQTLARHQVAVQDFAAQAPVGLLGSCNDVRVFHEAAIFMLT